VLALILLCIVIFAVNFQFFLEQQVAVRIISRSANQNNLFDMPMKDLMEVSVVSRS